MESNPNEQTLTLQQQRFCHEYMVSFNAFRAAMLAGYSENTARKGELLHLPKIQDYLKAAMCKTQQRLEITHDMILRELAKIAFANMGNFYDETGVLKPMYELTDDEKASISQYQILDAVDDDGYRVGRMAKIKLHNKLSALDKIARHLNFYGAKAAEDNVQKAESKEQNMNERRNELSVLSQESEVLTDATKAESMKFETPFEEPKILSEEQAILSDTVEDLDSQPKVNYKNAAIIKRDLMQNTQYQMPDVRPDLDEGLTDILTLSPLCVNFE